MASDSRKTLTPRILGIFVGSDRSSPRGRRLGCRTPILGIDMTHAVRPELAILTRLVLPGKADFRPLISPVPPARLLITAVRIASARSFLTRFTDLLPPWNELAASRHEAFTTNTIHGPELPSFPELARNVGGTLRPGFHVLHGQPGSGKTALALQLAGECRVSALYVTSEMGCLELVDRTIARTTKTSLHAAIFRPASDLLDHDQSGPETVLHATEGVNRISRR
jgi:DnaB-like helicase C terminal domain